MDFTNQTIKLWNMQNMDSMNPFNGGSPVASNKPVLPNRSSTADLVVDGFESGDLSSPTTNTVNFAWESTNRTSVVTGGAGANQVLHPTPSVVNDSRDWTAKEGSNSLRFEYPANQSQSEQRFNFDGQSDVWFRFWVRVPTNYIHTTVQPTNRKLFVIWQDAYDLPLGSLVAFEFWNNGADGSNLATNWSNGNGTSTGSHQQHAPFITYPTDQGRWMQVAIHVKTESSVGASDGVIQTYRRWDGEEAFTQLHDVSTASLVLNGAGFRNGYLMGWANGQYAEDTEWLIDNFEISSGSLV